MWLLAVSVEALALDPVWDVGAHVATHFLPVASPLGFPPKIRSYDFDGNRAPDDVTGDGLPDATTLEKVRFDLVLGASGSYWISARSRLSLRADLDLGRRFVAASGMGIYHHSYDLGPLYALVGGGLGFSSATWYGGDADERLRIPGFPLRAEGGALVPLSDFAGIEAELFIEMTVPANHRYSDIAGNERDLSGVPFTSTAMGLQLGFVYGQLR